MVSFKALVLSLCAVSAVRVEDVTEALETLDGSEETHSASNRTGAWVKPKLAVVDVAQAEAKFRSSEEPVLVPGEVVEMAFFDGYRDWKLYTSWRVLVVDGEATMATGYGKDAIPNKVSYHSWVWPRVMRDKQFVKVTQAGASKADRDVEVTLLPGGSPSSYSRDIGDEKLFEIAEYLRKKIDMFGKAAVLRLCSLADLQIGHHKRGICREQTDEEHKFEFALSFLNVPGIGISAPSPKSVEEILGPGRNMIGSDETVLYKFTETWSAAKRYDDMIVTDKQIITVDQKLSRVKKQYTSYPFPDGIGNKIWEYTEFWSMTTAARKGVDRDCELKVLMDRPWFKGTWFQMSFDKNLVKTADLFAYHSEVQSKIAKAQNVR